MKIAPEQRYRPNGDELASTMIDGDAVVVNLATGVYYSLDDTAGAIWQMIGEGHSLAGIAARLAARYDTSLEQAQADAAKLLTRLLEENLITEMEASSAPETAGTEPAIEHRQPWHPPEMSAYTDMSDLLALDPPMPGLHEKPAGDKE
jgi:hypothetical protein